MACPTRVHKLVIIVRITLQHASRVVQSIEARRLEALTELSTDLGAFRALVGPNGAAKPHSSM